MSELTKSEKHQLKPVRSIIVRQLRDLRREIELVHLEDGDQHFMSTSAACMLADVCLVLGLGEEDSKRVLGQAILTMLGE